MELKAQFVDLDQRRIYPAAIKVADGHIVSITPTEEAVSGYVLPGFVDAHVHIESSMLIPTEFARLATVHGTVATVSDPHEIANVLGVDGVRYMAQNAAQSPMHICLGVPSCVPATTFETAGATIGPDQVRALFEQDGLTYLSEMMNWPGVLHQDAEVMEKIRIAQELGRPIDGHAPGLKGEQARQYAAAGISTDHECFTLEEAQDKLACGMKIIIREGSAAKNFEALHPIISSHPSRVMFCSDDKHPDSLAVGHINQLAARAIAKGHELFDVLEVACRNAVDHYGLLIGQLRVGDPADMVLVRDLEQFEVLATYLRGVCVAQDGKPLLPSVKAETPNFFAVAPKSPAAFAMPAEGDSVEAIVPSDGELVTGRETVRPKLSNGCWEADPAQDLLKIVVVNRYGEAPVAKAFIRHFGLKRGAIASSVAHDSHNVIAVGADDAAICQAVNAVIRAGGGVSAVDGSTEQVLPLPVAGLMSQADGYEVARAYEAVDRMAKSLGSPLSAPFMTLSFMALLVIPALKLSDLGLFDGERFAFV